VSDALFVLAALVEAGLVPPDAYPTPTTDTTTTTDRTVTTDPTDPTDTTTPATSAGSAGWSSRPVAIGQQRLHPAAVDPRGWAREALLVSAEMGSSEARLAMGDRILHGRAME
jgi:hypothetical protein